MTDIYECVCCGLVTKTNLYPIGSGAFMEFCAPCAEAWLARQEGKGADAVWWIRRGDLLACFRRHDTSEERSRWMSNVQISRRRRHGLPRKLYAAWELTCQGCAERFIVRASPKERSPHVLELAKQQHQCPVYVNGHQETGVAALAQAVT